MGQKGSKKANGQPDTDEIHRDATSASVVEDSSSSSAKKSSSKNGKNNFFHCCFAFRSHLSVSTFRTFSPVNLEISLMLTTFLDVFILYFVYIIHFDTSLPKI
jgi:hypothetical protein